MKIRRLEISGFKSFADRVVFSFDDGITGVVGPNGCGKSNVVDAVRWAMGEQSAKHLRGRSMEDVIFSGSETRPPTGMAEVSLTFQNDGRLVPPQYAGFSEITVTRRLFRNGDSEYEINKTPCRLLDITERFRELRGELKQLELLAACRQWLAANQQEGRAAAELEQATDAEKVAQAQVSRLEAGLSAERLRLLEDERAVQELADRSHGVD